MSSITYRDEFLRCMADAGLAMHKPAVIADGTLHRYRTNGDRSGSTNGWYVLHLDEQPYGAFGSWKTGQSCTWTAEKQNAMSEAERRALAARMATAKQARDAEQAAVYQKAQRRAEGLWSGMKSATNDHPYLVRKQVHSYGLRDLRGQLVVPLRDENGILRSLQFIAADGRKTFLTGGRKRGCYFSIGVPDKAIIVIAEGYATAATIHQSTGLATAVAFDAGNLKPVAISLRTKFPRMTLLIAADDDSATPGNPGLTAAKAAADAVGGALAIPTFVEVANV